MARVALPESSLRARRRRRRLFTALLVALFLVAALGVAVWTSRTTYLALTSVEVRGVNQLSGDDLRLSVSRELEGSYFYLFPHRNVFLYPKEKIRADLLAANPAIKGVTVSPLDLHTLAVVIVERTPSALWCGAAQSASSTCLYLDEDGLAFARAPDFPGGEEYRRYYGALAIGPLPRQYLSPAEFHSLSALVDAVAKHQAPDSVDVVYVDEEKDAHIYFKSGIELIVTAADDGGRIYERFLLALQTSPFEKHPLSDFQYLDLRFGDHLYYKLKEGIE
jgi:hypothetical protein